MRARLLDVESVDELPGDGDAADRLGCELREGGGGEVEVVFRAGVALVLDGCGDTLSVVYEQIHCDEPLYKQKEGGLGEGRTGGGDEPSTDGVAGCGE